MSSLSEKFPDEIWLTIFKDEELEYKHLKRLTGVSKHFRELIKSSAFDKILFRTPIEKTEPLVVEEEVAIHPIFDKLDLLCSSYNSAFRPIFTTSQTTSSRTFGIIPEILNFPALQEFITSPTITDLIINMETGSLDIVISIETGITVKNFIDSIIGFWNGTDYGDVLADWGNGEDGRRMKVEMSRYYMLSRQGGLKIKWHLPLYVNEYKSGEPPVFLEVLEYVDHYGNHVEVEPAYE